MTSVLRFERHERVAVLTLDRPDRLNAIGSDTVAELLAHLEVIERDEELRAIVITGAGRAFSAGADITELETLRDGADFARFVSRLTDAYARLQSSPVPSIAAINGMALGGGFELALGVRPAARRTRRPPRCSRGEAGAAPGRRRLTTARPHGSAGRRQTTPDDRRPTLGRRSAPAGAGERGARRRGRRGPRARGPTCRAGRRGQWPPPSGSSTTARRCR